MESASRGMLGVLLDETIVPSNIPKAVGFSWPIHDDGSRNLVSKYISWGHVFFSKLSLSEGGT